MGEEGYASLISCPANPPKTVLRPANPSLNSYRGKSKGIGQSQLLTQKSLPSENVLFLLCLFNGRLWLWFRVFPFPFKTHVCFVCSAMLKYQETCSTISSGQVKVVSSMACKESAREHVGSFCNDSWLVL